MDTLPPPPPEITCEPELPTGGGIFLGDPESLKRLSDYAEARSIKLQRCGGALLLQGRPGMDREVILTLMKKAESGDFGRIKFGLMEPKGH